MITGLAGAPGQHALVAVREQVLREPATAVRLLRRRTGRERDSRYRALPAPLRQGLLAEAYLRTGKTEMAFAEILKAIGAMLGGTDRVPDEVVSRALPLAAVWADLSVYVGHEDAVECSRSYLQLAERAGDERRILLAGALRAVAVFQHEDGDRGRDWLGRVLSRYRAAYGDDLVRLMFARGLSVMADGLVAGRYWPAAELAFRFPVPGRQVWPACHIARRDYLASRVRLHRPRRPDQLSGSPS